jgi:tetratricopeptide (TPR) repeat protein
VVHSHDKNNRFWQASLLAPLVDYAKQNIASGDWEEAASYVEQIDKLLNSVNASRQEFRWSTREFESELAILKGAVLIEQQQWLEAIEVLTNVIDKGSKLGTSGRLVVNLEDTAEAYYFRGQALDALGNKQTAQEDYLIAADFYRQLKFIDPLKSIDLMRLFEKTGRREDAEAIRERLFNSGISPQIYK